MKLTKLLFVTFITALSLSSCNPNDNTPGAYVPLGSYDSGVLVMNQGNGHSNTSLSYISFDLNTLQNDIFAGVNTTPILGNFPQDIGLNNTSAYIVLSGESKIQIANRYTMQSTGTIVTGLQNPRYIVFANNKAYVTNQGADFSISTDDFISVYDLSTNALIHSIPVTAGSAEKMVVNNGKLYVEQGGEFGTGNTIAIIDLATDNIIGTINIGDSPNSMQIDNGFLWVLCGGTYNYYPAPAVATSGKLLKIDLATNQFAKIYDFGSTSFYPTNFDIFGSNGYYTIGSAVYKMALTDAALPATAAFTSAAMNTSAFAIKNNHIYIGDANDFSSNGKVYIYSLGTSTSSSPIGTLEKTHTVGIIPAGFYFNQ